MGSVNSLHGLEVGCAFVSISELGTAHTVVGNSPAVLPRCARWLLGFSPFIQPCQQGSCCQRYVE